jgi:predicted transcriptional regulator
MSHARWKLARERKITEGHTESPEVEAMRVEIRMAFDLGQAVYDSQTELAKRANMTQPQISKLELGGTVPTLPLLARLAKALDASLNIALDGDTSAVVFTPHAA